MTNDEWQTARRDLEPLTNGPVQVTLINDHAVEGLLTGVGYGGLRILPAGTGRELHYEYRLVKDVARIAELRRPRQE